MAQVTKDSHHQHLSRLARGGTLSVVGAASNGVLSFLLVVAVTHGFPKQVAGALFAATSFFLILVAAAKLGTDTGIVRSIPRHLVRGRQEDIHATLRTSLVPVAVVGVLLGLAVFLMAPQLANWLAKPAQEAEFTAMLRVLAVFLPVATVYDVLLAGTRAYGDIRPTVLVERLGRVGAQPVAVLVAAALGTGVVGLTFAWSLAYVPALLAACFFLLRAVRRQAPSPDEDRPAALPRREVVREFWSFTGPRAVARFFQVALQRVDIVMVAALRSPEEAAIYTAASRLVGLGLLGVQAVQQVLQPVVSRLLAENDRSATNRVFRMSTAWSMVLAWPVYLVTATAAPLILGVFGPGYTDGETAVIVLSIAMLIATATGPVDIVLLMSGRSGLSLFNSAVALAVNVGLNFVLIPRYGILGAAISWAAAIFVVNLLALLQVRRTMHMVPAGKATSWAAGSAVLTFGLGPLLARQLWGTGPAVMIPTLGVCAGLYAGALWRGRDVLALSSFEGMVSRRRRRGAAGNGATGDGVTAGAVAGPGDAPDGARPLAAAGEDDGPAQGGAEPEGPVQGGAAGGGAARGGSERGGPEREGPPGRHARSQGRHRRNGHLPGAEAPPPSGREAGALHAGDRRDPA